MSTRTPTARRGTSRAATPALAAVATETARPDRKQAILLAAEKLFSQHGYHVVTIR
ncbi:TetR/AcrR family transcriptional regulator, partial [Mycobacterium tuberculosis]